MTMIASRRQLRAAFIRWSLLLVPLCILLGMVSAQISGSGADDPWFAALRKPAIYPPAYLFAVVWTVLYAMMGFAAALVLSARGAKGRGLAIVVFFVQLAVNLAWSPVFFGQRDISTALGVVALLDALVLITLILFWRVRPLAGLLLVPYLGWGLFATALNWQFLEANPDAGQPAANGAVQRVEF